MRFPVFFLAGFLVLGGGCDQLRPDTSDKVFSIDKTVDQATADRLGGLLLEKVPSIKAEKASRQVGGKTVQLIVRVESAPEPGYEGPDRTYHREYYWMYVGYHGKDSLLKYYRYLIHKDTKAILFYDDAKDEFIKPS
jgi:hypothetical protein